MFNKKITFYFFSFIIFFFALSIKVNADYSASYVSDGKCSLISSSTGNCLYKDNTFKTAQGVWLNTGNQITVYTNKGEIAAPKNGNGSECKSTYVWVSYVYNNKTYSGYACKANIRPNSVDGISDKLKQEFKNANFPESYWLGLSILKEAHPNWTFVAVNTGLDFNTAVANEDSGNRSLIQSTSSATQGYLSTKETNYNWSTDKFKVYDGTSFYAANQATIAYYMDPRNFLSETSVFQFEMLSYDSKIHNLDGVKSVLGSAYIGKFADKFMLAATQTNVNPIYLASLARQEIGGGTTAGRAVSGQPFTYNGVKYNHAVYNFYNIGAYSGSDAAIKGLIYANGGENASGGYGKDTSYNRPWTTEEKAIIGGAMFIVDGYMKVGQDTSYFKKWDVQSLDRVTGKKLTKNLYTHQYMQNIQAPKEEAYTTYNTYLKNSLLNSNFSFLIPVYNNMPTTPASLPAQGNPNNYLKTLTYNDGSGNKNINNFSGATTSYTFHVANGVSSITLAGTTVNSSAKISGTGTKNLNVGNNNISIVVTAGNGSKRTYTINVIRDVATGDVKPLEQVLTESQLNFDENYLTGLTLTTSIGDLKNVVNKVEPQAGVSIKRSGSELTSGYVVTGDTITITSNGSSKTYTIVLYGDTNGDGKINALDLLRVQKHILGTNKLTGTYSKAADVSKDGSINALDLLKVQKHILGTAFIAQR